MRAETRAFLRQDGVEEEVVEDVVLCIQEACKNAIRFSRSPAGMLLHISLAPGCVIVVVRDYGIGMKPGTRVLAPAPLAEHGRGLSIMRCLMDDLQVRVGDGTEVRMVKRMAAEQTRSDASGRLCA